MPGSESGNTFICPQWVESVILYSCNRCRRGHVNRIYATKLQMRMLTSTIIAQWSGKPKLLAQNTSKTFRLSHSDYHKGLTKEPYGITTSVGALLEYSDCLSYSMGQSLIICVCKNALQMICRSFLFLTVWACSRRSLKRHGVIDKDSMMKYAFHYRIFFALQGAIFPWFISKVMQISSFYVALALRRIYYIWILPNRIHAQRNRVHLNVMLYHRHIFRWALPVPMQLPRGNSAQADSLMTISVITVQLDLICHTFWNT